MSPAQYGELLAAGEPPLTDAQVEAAARLLAGVHAEGLVAA